MASIKKKKTIIITVIVILIILFGVIFGIQLKKIALEKAYPLKYLDIISKYSEEYSLEPSFVASVIYVESRFDNDAESHKGAIGLMQLMPDTAEWIAGKMKIKDYDVDMLKEPDLNIEMGCWYLEFLNQRFNSEEVVLAAYNGGHNRIKQWLDDEQLSDDGETLKDIPYKETDDYVQRVEDAKEKYEELYAKELGIDIEK